MKEKQITMMAELEQIAREALPDGFQFLGLGNEDPEEREFVVPDLGEFDGMTYDPRETFPHWVGGKECPWTGASDDLFYACERGSPIAIANGFIPDEEDRISRDRMPLDLEEEPTPIFPEDAAERKTYPMFRGLLQYFPHALAAVAKCSHEGNQQHHPDKPLHWDKSKSTDEADALVRHLLEGDLDKVAWRSLALLERSMTDNSSPRSSTSL